jgi:branched-subunit amino acid aminotransferase/4-amino-4-deoxychorismate lyase
MTRCCLCGAEITPIQIGGVIWGHWCDFNRKDISEQEVTLWYCSECFEKTRTYRGDTK